MHWFTTFFTLLPLFSTLVLAEAHGNNPPYRRHLSMPKRPAGRDDGLVVRAGGPISNDTMAAISSAEQWSSMHQSATTDGTTDGTTTTSATGSGQYGDTIAPITTTSSSSSSSITSSSSTTSLSSSSIEPSASPVAETSVSPVPVSSAPAPSSTMDANAPVTLPSTSSSQTSATTSTRTTSRVSITTATRTASASSTASVEASNAGSSGKSGGLSKTALIVIIVLASVVGLGAVLVFAIRKWKLKPSNRFDARMKPIDFSPRNDGMNDDFLEKTLHRTASNDMADRQRQQFVKELEADPNYVAGIPDHDFTAGTTVNNAGYGATYNDEMYNHDPFAHAQAYEYDESNTYYAPQHGHAYPPAGVAGHGEYAAHTTDYPTQDTEHGYTNLQRGNSNGSDHAPHTVQQQQQQQVYPSDFPSADQYLGRPTGGADGPYAQAAQYRTY